MHIDFVRYDPAGPDTGTNAHINKEIVVIKNGTGKARSLTGWTLRDTSSHVYRFPAKWNNTGDRATLRTKGFTLIDRCKWGDGDGSTGC